MTHRPVSADRSAGVVLSLVTVLLLAGGCSTGRSGVASGEPAKPSPEESVIVEPTASPGGADLECGARWEPTPPGVLTVTGHFPDAVLADDRLVAGTVTVAATGRGATGVVTPQAQAFLVRDGRIITLPMPQDAVGRRLDLTDGRAERMPAPASLLPCSGGVLAPGEYDVYVRVVLNHDDGSRSDSLGGPWSLEVR